MKPNVTILSRVRALLGANDNPNLQEFKSSIRKLLFYNEITSSVFANCEDNLNILTVSSSSTEETRDERIDTAQDERQVDDQFEEIEVVQSSYPLEAELQTKEDVTIGFIAGQIEKKVESCRFGCIECGDLCRRIFIDNDKISGPFPENRKTQRPCESTYIICKYTHETLKEKIARNPSNFDYKQTYELILERMIGEAFFVESNFSHDEEHQTYLIRYIIDEYIRSYATYVAQCLTLEQQRILIRNKNRKVTHFRGQ